MVQLDREGTFKAVISEHTVNTTRKSDLPQLVARFGVTQSYDEDTGEWADWTPYDMEIIGYLVLFSQKGPCLNYDQVQKATGWDGASFDGLDNLDLSDKVVLIRVEEDEYEGKTRLKVTWIDAEDAEPGRSLKKLDAGKLKSLNAKWGLGKKASPAKPPTAPPKAPPEDDPPAAEPAEKPAPPRRQKRKAGAVPPPKSAAPAKSDSEDDETPHKIGENYRADTCTKEDAYAAVVDLKVESVTDDQVGEAWFAAINKVAGEDADDSEITPEQWAAIREEVLANVDHIPF